MCLQTLLEYQDQLEGKDREKFEKYSQTFELYNNAKNFEDFKHKFHSFNKRDNPFRASDFRDADSESDSKLSKGEKHSNSHLEHS